MALPSPLAVRFRLPFGAALVLGAVLPWLLTGPPAGPSAIAAPDAPARSPSPGVEFERLPTQQTGAAPDAGAVPAGFEPDTLLAQPPLAPGAFMQVAPPLGGGLVTTIE
ncbi:hypothetical protein D3C72_769960 [compost metagenome]